MTIPQNNFWRQMGSGARFTSRAMDRKDWRPGHLANVLVGPYAPQYAAMCERAKGAPDYEWRKDEHGIHVPFMWLK
jgi:hypothetical protein